MMEEKKGYGKVVEKIQKNIWKKVRIGLLLRRNNPTNMQEYTYNTQKAS